MTAAHSDQQSSRAAGQPGDRTTKQPGNGVTEQPGSRATGRRLGITLIELLVAMAIVAAIVGIAYPSFTSGLAGIRLRTSIDRVGAFFSSVRQAADRRQQPAVLTVEPEANRLTAFTVDEGWKDELVFDNSLKIAFPKKRFVRVLLPASPPPRFRLLLEADSGGRAGLEINILTGVPEPWDLEKGELEP